MVLYEMLAGSPPFHGETPSDCIAAILTAEPPPLSGVSRDVPAELESILQKALRKNSDERFQTIKEMLAELRFLKGKLEAKSFLADTKPHAEFIVGKIKRHKRSMLVTLAAMLWPPRRLPICFSLSPPRYHQMKNPSLSPVRKPE